jgi:hypothetical protein
MAAPQTPSPQPWRNTTPSSKKYLKRAQQAETRTSAAQITQEPRKSHARSVGQSKLGNRKASAMPCVLLSYCVKPSIVSYITNYFV